MSEAKSDRDARRAAALRENLKRRKAAARARAREVPPAQVQRPADGQPADPPAGQNGTDGEGER